jgi:hypothetical protein
MSPLTHLVGSWLVAAVATDNPRDRRLVTLAGVIPDADGLGLAGDAAKALVSGQEITFAYYQHYHHLLLHGWPAALVIAGILAACGRRRVRVALLCLLTFHLHLLCDLLGSRGPAPTDLWPICYSEPLFRHPIWFWKNQWKLDGWQSQMVFVSVFATSLWLAVRRGYSFVGVFNQRADAVFVAVLRKWRDQLFRPHRTQVRE